MDDNRGARRTDPETSHRAVRRLLNNHSLYEAIVREAAYAYDRGLPFRDTWLAARVGRDRNVVARVRLEVEHDGWIERCGTTKDGNELLFRMKGTWRKVLDMLPDKGWLDDGKD